MCPNGKRVSRERKTRYSLRLPGIGEHFGSRLPEIASRIAPSLFHTSDKGSKTGAWALSHIVDHAMQVEVDPISYGKLAQVEVVFRNHYQEVSFVKSCAFAQFFERVAAEMDFYPQYLPWAFVIPSVAGAREDGKLSLNLHWDGNASRFADVIGVVITYIEVAQRASAELP